MKLSECHSSDLVDDGGRLSQTDPVLALTRTFEWLLRIGFALVPSAAIAYLHFYSNLYERLVNYGFHEFAIGTAVSLSAFIAYITWRCYRHSGEPFLFWVALGLTGFTAIYLPHGVLTRTADCNIWLFLIFGPASRVVMIGCFFMGLLHYGQPPHDALRRHRLQSFWVSLGIFAAIDGALAAAIAYAPSVIPILRLLMEGGAVLLAVASIVIFFWRRQRMTSPLLWMYILAMAASAQASIAFLLARPWDHQWWLAHVISAGSFFMLSYGILVAFHTTRAFSTVYSQEEMMTRLEEANQELDRMASYDFLTGAANRRLFLKLADEELARADRAQTPTSLLLMDIDHFKKVNDRYGHLSGDGVLAALVERVRDIVRTPDLIGRFGGEEFVVLLPGSSLAQAQQIAERIRKGMAQSPVTVDKLLLDITVSIGVAEFGVDGTDVTSVLRTADQRLYAAKAGGRNRVVSETVSSHD